jgi:hypothetical protein
MNLQIKKFWEESGNVWSRKTGNRKNYIIKFFMGITPGISPSMAKYFNLPYVHIATCYVNDKNKKWEYYWDNHVISEHDMIRIIGLKIFL